MLLEKGDIKVIIKASIGAFCFYSSMYAFRKPFAVGLFNDIHFLGIDYKILLIIAQLLGYTLSKFIGIKYISELKKNNRARLTLWLILFAELSLIAFANFKPAFNIIFLFFNGLSLGLIWGIVINYLEGRKYTDILMVVLCSSFIFSSGLVKSVGKYLIVNWEVSEFSMPYITGIIFIFPLILSVRVLENIPQPTQYDIELRTKREPMDKNKRKDFFNKFYFGIIALVFVLVLLTVLRDFRDNFAADIWSQIGMNDSYSVFILTEIPISIVVLIVLGLFFFIESSKKAFMLSIIIILIGILIIGGSTFLLDCKVINTTSWMVLFGTGLYLAYVPFHSILFERMISAFKYTGTIGFVMYIADAFSYLGSTLTLLFKNFFLPHNLDWLHFIKSMSYITCVIGVVIISIIYFYFQKKLERF